MPTSQNGWPANDSSLIATYTVPGSSVRISLRKGDVSVVLLHLAAWFHRTIQPLRQSDTGGYNPRPIRGGTALSNHASGTAEDLRWNDHPLGAVGTFTAKQATAIRAQLRFYEGVIRWGGDYSGRKDEMHFEINKGSAAVKAVADKIREEIPVALTAADKTWLSGQINAAVTKLATDNTAKVDDLLVVRIGDKANPGRTVGDVLRDLAKLRGYLVGDAADTKNAAIRPDAPVVKVVSLLGEIQKALPAAKAGE